MLKQIPFYSGFLYGILFPAAAWLVFSAWLKNRPVYDKPGVPYLIAIACNLIWLRYLVKNDREVAGYGLMASTFIISMAIFKFKL